MTKLMQPACLSPVCNFWFDCNLKSRVVIISVVMFVIMVNSTQVYYKSVARKLKQI